MALLLGTALDRDGGPGSGQLESERSSSSFSSTTGKGNCDSKVSDGKQRQDSTHVAAVRLQGRKKTHRSICSNSVDSLLTQDRTTSHSGETETDIHHRGILRATGQGTKEKRRE